MKIHYNKNYFERKKGALTESIFCIPFEDSKNFQEEDFENDRFGNVMSRGKNYLEYTNIEDCDYVVIPYKWDGRTNQNMDIINEAKKHGKKVVALHNDDAPPFQKLHEEEGFMFTTTLEQTRKGKNEFSFPAFCGDFFDDFEVKYIRDTAAQKTIGFCGAITHNIRTQALNKINSIPNFKKNFIIRKGFWAPEVTKEVARQQYFDNMKDNCFIVCMRGAGNFSYRLYETMMMGRIPIIIDTNQVFPFSRTLNYNEFAIVIPQEKVIEANEIISDWINSKDEKQLVEIQKNNRKIWLEYMSPLGWIKSFSKELNDVKNNGARLKKRKIKVLLYGLQRSGTNYLEQLLKKDEKITFINSTDRKDFKHKHYRFHDKMSIVPKEYVHEKEILNVGDIYKKSGVDNIIVIKKNIYDWYISIAKYAKQFNWKFSDKDFADEYIEEYYLNYKFFENENVILIEYQDLLFNKNKIINKLRDSNIEIEDEDFIIDNVFASRMKNEHYLEKYSIHNLKYKKEIDEKMRTAWTF